jgi:hypothetical protein
MKDAVIEIFNKWIEGPVSHYHLADKDIYRVSDAKTPRRSPLNPFLKNEADIRIKFGGFLEQELLGSGGGLTVHAELKPTQDDTFYCCMDLSIHEVPNDLSLATNDNALSAETVRAVIQVRFIDFLASNNKVYDYTDFHSDFACLNEFPKQAGKFLLIIDEGEAMDSNVIDDVRRMARECKVELISNNEYLCSKNF